MLTEYSHAGHASKCVYIAPTKALCSERYRDWTAKFDALGLKCQFGTPLLRGNMVVYIDYFGFFG
jgi:replicative superfamily II helicase